jgi:hypothetical protein
MKEGIVSGKKLLLVGLAVVFALSSVFMVACGGNDEAGKKTMQDALTVVEADMAQLTAGFSSGQGTGAQVKAAVAGVAPHWQAVVDACAAVKGADATKAKQVYAEVQTAVTALSDTAGLAEMAALLGPVQVLQTFVKDLRTLVGVSTTTTAVGGEVTTTVAP